MNSWVTVAFAILALPSVATGSIVDVNTCGQVITTAGFLSADLDCSGTQGYAVTIKNGQRLDLQGHTIIGAGYAAIFCPNGCSVVSTVAEPGMIRDSPRAGITGGKDLIFVNNVSIVGNGSYGVQSDGSIEVEDSTVSTNGDYGLFAYRNITVVRSEISDNPFGGVYCYRRLKVIDSDVHANGVFGLRGGSTINECCRAKLMVVRSVISRNQIGVDANGTTKIDDSTITQSTDAGVVLDNYDLTLRVRRSMISSNVDAGVRWARGGTRNGVIQETTVRGNGGSGIDAVNRGPRMKLTDTIIEDNGGDGIRDSFNKTLILRRCQIRTNLGHGVVQDRSYGGHCRLKLLESEVTGNGVGPSCGMSQTCADIATCDSDLPVIDTGSQCGSSYVLSSGFPGETWGICSLD